MPVRQRRDRRRNAVPEWQDEMDLDLGWLHPRTDDEMRPLWEQHRDYMMARAIEATPGTRPHAFWVFDVENVPASAHDEPDILFAMGEMDEAEIAAVRATWGSGGRGPMFTRDSVS
jgi:hypothetical protein